MALGSAKKKASARTKKAAAKTPRKSVAAKKKPAAAKKAAAKKKAVAPKRRAAAPKPTPKKKAAAPRPKPEPKKKAAAPGPKSKPKKKAAAPKPRKAAAPRKAPAAAASAAIPRPSERLMAACALLPREERALDDSERSAMTKVAAKARLLLNGGYGAPADVVARIARYVDDVRSGAAAPPRDRDELFGLGVLWGEQLRAQVGWLWVHLAYEDGLSSFALVPDDRAFAVFPINRLLDLLGPSGSRSPGTTIVERFEAICSDQLPQRRSNAYLVIG